MAKTGNSDRSTPSDRASKAGIGCLYVLIIGVATTLLLVLNILLVGAFIQVNREWFLNPYADETVQFRLAQAAQIFIPVILTFMEFWIFDRIVDRAFGYTKRGKGEFSETDKSNDFVR